MADKIYEFNGKYYSETDRSLDLPDGVWGGDLYDLYFDYNKKEPGVLCEETRYYAACYPECVYEDYMDLVADFFEESEVSAEEMMEAVSDEQEN